MKTIIVILGTSLLSACAVNYKPPMEVNETFTSSHNSSKVAVLNEAKRQLVMKGYQIQVFDNDAGIISTSLKNYRLTPEQADCGKTMGLDYLKDNRTKTEVALNVIATETEVTVKSNIHGEYKPGSVDQDITLTCVSKGKIEQELLSTLVKVKA